MITPSLRLTAGLPTESRRIEAVVWSAVERVIAGLSLILLLPAMALLMLAVALVSGKSPLIAHRRLGRYGEEFWMFKIRTMWSKNQPCVATRPWIEYISDAHVPVFKGARDPRVTSPLARFCRRYSLDELPQLIHVLNGSMRMVGPRPITRVEWDEYYGASAAEVLKVSPGMTGLWQVMGRNRFTYTQRLRLDLFYARHKSPLLDLLLLLQTPARVLSGRNAG
jgi:lipopolysaccharide/colanic/teichoic acid biosynthesis glycosyltransferase